VGLRAKRSETPEERGPPDKTLFETGDDYLRKSQFIKARLAFQTLINTYPDSDMLPEAYMAIGDSFYDEGGIENLLQAEDQYKNFIVFFPTSPMAEHAQLKIISANMRQMRTPDRDRSYTIKAENEIKKFLQMFPKSEYLGVAQQYLNEVQENLALGNYGIGQFYNDRGNLAGARLRYKEIVDQYPNFSRMDETYYQLAQVLEKSNNPDEAAIYYGRLATGYPFSRYFEDSKTKLAALGKPVPQVDVQLAAHNQGLLKKPEGFSPLQPLISFAEALGFKGPQDRYEAAIQTVETQKAAAQAGAQGQGQPGGDDILIQTTIKKDQSGATNESTVLGGNANPTPAPADKKEEPKPRN
jgi:outer membrane protein assembly factor BamD